MERTPYPVFVEVLDEPVQSNSYVKNGQPAVLRRQKVYFHQSVGYPLPSEIVLAETAAPYRPGRYLIGGEVFRVGVRHGKEGKAFTQLAFSDMELDLIPVEQAIAILTNKPAKAA